MKRLFLASQSPRRRQLIQLLGLPVQIINVVVDEDSVGDPDPAVDVVKTALLKATAAINQVSEPNAVIIGADTTVALDGQMLGKPVDENEARMMLRCLRGRTHEVHTGLAIIDKKTRHHVTDVATVQVPMRHYSDAEIEAYVASGDPLDKAGAYAIQHAGFHPVANLQGCYAGVVGLPLCHLTRALRHLSLQVHVDIAVACQSHHEYTCPVYESILSGP